MKTVLQVLHKNTLKGPGHFLEDYLIQRKFNFFSIHHPLDKSKIRISQMNKNKIRIFKKNSPKNFLIQLVQDFILSILWCFKINQQIDCYIGMNNFDTLPGLLMKKLKVKKVIYYSSDFSHKRFENTFLNFIYKSVEIYCLKNADIVISNSKRAESARMKMGLNPRNSIVIPNGVKLGKFKVKKREKIFRFIYAGDITKEHGILHVIIAFKEISKFYKNFELVIIGNGPDDDKLKKIISKNNFYRYVKILGRIPNSEVIDYLSKHEAIGLAPYTLDKNWTYYCSPVKIKEYLGCGLPVICSNVVEIAEDIQKYKLGFVYKDDKELNIILKNIFNHKKETFELNKNIKNYIKNYDWYSLFSKKLLPELK